MKLEITNSEFLDLMKAHRKDNMERAIEKLITQLRHDDENNGLEHLKELLTTGAIKMDLYLQLCDVVTQKDAPYEIEII